MAWESRVALRGGSGWFLRLELGVTLLIDIVEKERETQAACVLAGMSGNADPVRNNGRPCV